MRKIVTLLLSLSLYLMAWEGYDAANSSYITLQSTYSKDGQSYIRIYDHSDYREKELLVTNVRRSSSFYILNVYDSFANEKRMFEMQVPKYDNYVVPKNLQVEAATTTVSLPASETVTPVSKTDSKTDVPMQSSHESEKMTLGEFFDMINIFKYLKLDN